MDKWTVKFTDNPLEKIDDPVEGVLKAWVRAIEHHKNNPNEEVELELYGTLKDKVRVEFEKNGLGDPDDYKFTLNKQKFIEANGLEENVNEQTKTQ